jgi:hypothetical protein
MSGGGALPRASAVSLYLQRSTVARLCDPQQYTTCSQMQFAVLKATSPPSTPPSFCTVLARWLSLWYYIHHNTQITCPIITKCFKLAEQYSAGCDTAGSRSGHLQFSGRVCLTKHPSTPALLRVV